MSNNTQPAIRRVIATDAFCFILITAIVVTTMYYGWKLFWFLTDDAFIAFRYVSNSHLGYGYVWNRPPFLPVEGYTSFLWVLLLDLIWRITGVEPPDAANWISLLFTYANLLVASLMVLKMKLSTSLRRWRVLLLCLVLLGTITNRTLLAWSSSGLETAMFNFFFTLWIYAALFVAYGSYQWFWGMSIMAGMLYLTRPDGLLMAAATLALALFALTFKKGRSASKFGQLGALSPLLVVPAHLLWRYSIYGEWLPNTYYAKSDTGRILFDSGLKYLLAFIMEYALWVWLIVLAVLVVYGLRQVGSKSFWELIRQPISEESKSAPALIVSTTVAAHLSYYTILVGGDHFEYRVYSYLIPLIFISFIWMLNALHLNFGGTALLISLFIVLSWPIPWAHWAASQAFTTREETVFLKVSVAEVLQERLPNFPKPLVSYLQFYDELQFTLIDKLTAVRHQEHKVFYEYLIETLPERTKTETTPNYPLMIVGSTGVVSWVYPHVSFIDSFGLNDYVIARNPSLRSTAFMAHERKPPPGYLDCLAPGANFNEIVDVTAETIIGCEQIFREWTRSPELAPALMRVRDEPAFALNAQFGKYFLLQGYDLEVQADTFSLTLYWESLQKSDFDYSAFIHLMNENGERVWQLDRPPGSGQNYPPTQWQPGERLLDTYSFDHLADLDPVSINIGMYNWQTGERLVIFPVEEYPEGFVPINNRIMIRE